MSILKKYEVTTKILRLATVDEHIIAVYERNKMIPCDLEKFLTYSGEWIEEVKTILTKRMAWNSAGEVVSVQGDQGLETFTFHESGVGLIGVIDFDGQKMINHYDEENRCLSSKVADSEGNVLGLISLNHYEDGRLLNSTQANYVAQPDGTFMHQGEVKTDYTFDENNNCIRQKVVDVANNDIVLDFTVDENGNQTAVAIYNNGELQGTDTFEYDKHNNLIAQYNDGELRVEVHIAYVNDTLHEMSRSMDVDGVTEVTVLINVPVVH